MKSNFHIQNHPNMTNKAKCLATWEYIAMTGRKSKYLVLKKLFGESEADFLSVLYSCCYACKEAQKNCSKCPISWGKFKGVKISCFNEPVEPTNIYYFHTTSPYIIWCDTSSRMERIQAARKICFLIRTTWEEKSEKSA